MRIAGILLLLFGAVVLALSANGPDLPERARLTEVSGQLRSLEKVTSKGGGVGAVRFTLAGDPRHFSYPSSAGNANEVWGALEQAGRAPLSVLIDAAGPTHSPLLDERAFHTAFEIRVSGKTVRPYSEVAHSLRGNDWIGLALGSLSAGIGAVLLALHFRKRNL